MRAIKYLVIHCSATKAGKNFTAGDIDTWHRARGFKKIGYHYVIYLDGTIVKGREMEEVGAHVSGNNSNSIGICYIGGLDANGNAADTRTNEQRASLCYLLERLKEEFPKAKILGHRDFSPDLNGNGIIEPWEYIKECPCFDAKNEYKNL